MTIPYHMHDKLSSALDDQKGSSQSIVPGDFHVRTAYDMLKHRNHDRIQYR